MVLQKRIIQLPFQGLQTKVDPKLAPIGSYEELDNVVMNRYPELNKRDGLGRIGSSSVPSNINAVYSYINEIGVITDDGVYSYSQTADKFLLKGSTSSPVIIPTPIIANTYSQTNCDSGTTTGSTTSGYTGTVWEDSRGGVRCSIQDIESNTFILSDYPLSATGQKPRVIATSSRITFFWLESGTTSLMGIQYSTNSNTFSSPVTISSTISTSLTYDAIACNNNILLVYLTTGPAVYASYWYVGSASIAVSGQGVALTTELDMSNITDTTTTTMAVCTNTPTNSDYFVVSWQTGDSVWTRSFDTDFTPLSPEAAVSALLPDPGVGMTCCVDSSNNTYIFYSTYGTVYTSYYALVEDNVTLPAVTNTTFFLQMTIASKAFIFTNKAYVVLSYPSPSKLQNTYFGVRNDGAVWGRMFSGYGGGAYTSNNCASNICIRPDKENTYTVALMRLTELSSSSSGLTAQNCIYEEQFFFTPSNIDNSPINNLLNIAGGYLKNYDGSETVFEQGFHLYPETPSHTIETGGDAAIPNGTYSYIVCWEWQDKLGNLYRSSPSVPVTIVLSGGPSKVTITVPSLPITNKETRFNDKRTNVICAVYRTKTIGTTYYKINQATSTFVYNDPTSPTVSVVDNYTDTAIASNTLLYTTGGVFENIVLPSTNLMCISQNRVVVSGSDVFPNQVFYSKEIQAGIAVEFSLQQSFFVQSQGGFITAIAAMDDKIIMFKETLIYYVSGVLLDNTGTNGAVPQPVLISTTCGCNYPQSIVLTQFGLMFQSPKGIYLLDRSLNVSYIGQAIDKYTTNVTPPLQITSAVNLTNQNQIVFTDSNNQGFIYDTVFQQWYTQTYNFSPVAANILLDKWYVCSDNQMFEQIPGQTFDNLSAPIVTTIKTNWISFAGLDGFCRIYAIFIYGTGTTNVGTLRANLYYDFQDYQTESVSIIPYDLASATTWGSDTTWGSGTRWGGTFDGSYNFMIRPGRQKCTAIKIEIFDDFPTGNTSESFSFSGITMAVGVKPTWNKSLSYTRRLT